MANVTGEPSDLMGEEPSRSAVIYIGVVLYLGLTLNIIALISIGWFRSSRRRTIPLIIMTELLSCDLAALLLYAVRRFVRELLISVGDDFYCNIFGATNMFFPLLSGLFAVMLAFERYCAIAAPFRYRGYFTLSRTAVTSLAVVCVALAISAMPLVGVGSYIQEGTSSADNRMICKLFWKQGETPLYTLQFVIYFTTAVSLTTAVVSCNLGLTSQLVGMRRRVAALTLGQKVSRGREIKFVWTVMLITIAFLVCWMPWVLSLALCKLGLSDSDDFVVVASRFLLLNHTLDPCIYLVSRHGKKLCNILNQTTPDPSAETTVGISLAVTGIAGSGPTRPR